MRKLNRRCPPGARRYVFFWHKAESCGSATTWSVVWGIKRHAEQVDPMPAIDPMYGPAVRCMYGPAVRCKRDR
jgi:hypothetical protein